MHQPEDERIMKGHSEAGPLTTQARNTKAAPEQHGHTDITGDKPRPLGANVPKSAPNYRDRSGVHSSKKSR